MLAAPLPPVHLYPTQFRYTPHYRAILCCMSRKQVGSIDGDLLAEVDRRAEFLGQTRRVFIERTLQQRLVNPDWKITEDPSGSVLDYSANLPAAAPAPVPRQHRENCKCPVCS